MRRIGIYGGSFNPPHLGHVLAARNARALLQLGEILFIPAAIPPHKAVAGGSPDGETRLALTELAIAGEPGMSVSRIELSISSPICNSSGALVAVLCLITGTLDESITGAMRWMVIGAVALVCIGVVGLGIVESREDDELRKKRQECSNYKYAKSWLALCLPVAYCLLDAAGTFADSLVLRTLNEDSANCAYELTFLAAAVICFIYVVIIKKDKLVFKAEAPKYAGALFETAGQFAYIYALADEAHVALSAPIISAYCVASVLWSRIFLKEKLSWKHYAMIALVVIGIVMIGVFDI